MISFKEVREFFSLYRHEPLSGREREQIGDIQTCAGIIALIGGGLEAFVSVHFIDNDMVEKIAAAPGAAAAAAGLALLGAGVYNIFRAPSDEGYL